MDNWNLATRRKPCDRRLQRARQLLQHSTLAIGEIAAQVGYNSQSVVVSGAVDAPLRQPIANTRFTLLDAINGAGGAREDADLRAVALKRNGNNYVVDLRGFFENGFRENNPVLQNGDVVFVPRRQPEERFERGRFALGKTDQGQRK